MIQYDKIVKSFQTLVGWKAGRSDDDTDFIVSAGYPTQSDSGLYYQDAHPLLTLKNVFQAGSDTGVSNDRKRLEVLHNINTRAIRNLIQNFVRIKQLSGETKDLLEDRVLFYGSANRRALTDAKNELVGFAFSPTQSTGVSVKISQIGFQFTPEAKNSDKPFYLYLGSVGSIEPEYAIAVDRQKFGSNDAVTWLNISDMTVNGETGVSDITIPGSPYTSQWVLYYDASELTNIGATSLNIGRDWSKAPCTCNRQHYNNFVEYSKYMKVNPFRSGYSGDTEDTKSQVPYADAIVPDYQNNFGLNVRFSVGCDLTDFIISQRGLFASALQKQLAYDVLREMAMNPSVRVNRNQANISRMEILYELDGNGTVPGGIKNDLEQTLKALDFSTDGMDRVCLQCKNKGVKYGSV